MTKAICGIKITFVWGVSVLYCISLNYKNADVDLRKRLAFSQAVCNKIISALIKSKYISECVMLCTCNRTEVYYCGERSSEKYVVAALAEGSGIIEELLSKNLLFFHGDNAILHLFKVACGIDSMVIGEDEILGQTKRAYMQSKENNFVSYELNMIFQSAFACAKKIKTKTALSKTSVSVATLAANEAARLGENVSVLVIGASGKTGATVLKNLVSHKNVSVKATLRQHNSHLKLIDDMGIETVDYKNRYEYIQSADCVISATSSPHYTVTLYDLKKHISGDKKRLFIDLAVPPDIDASITDINGVRLINIDYFERLARENNELKADSVYAAKEIISQEIDELKKDMIFHSFLPSIDEVKSALSDKPLEELIYRMKNNASAEEFSAFIKILKTFAAQE